MSLCARGNNSRVENARLGLRADAPRGEFVDNDIENRAASFSFYFFALCTCLPCARFGTGEARGVAFPFAGLARVVMVDARGRL